MVIDLSLHLVILAASGAGLVVSMYVCRHKITRAAQPMVCPMHADCDTVVNSKYSKFFGIPVEYLGVLYYATILTAYLMMLLVPEFKSTPALYLMLGFSGGAFLFSLYLTFIQIFNLREYCSWCLFSAGLSTLIFLAAFMGLWWDILPVFASYKILFVGLHLIGVSLGVGGALISDVFFFRFLKDLKISVEESKTLDLLSQVIWLALAIIVISGVALYLPEMKELNESGKFLGKMMIVVVIVINGAFLNLMIAPKLTELFSPYAPGGASEDKTAKTHRLRKIAFGMGAISMVSWLSALIVATMPRNAEMGIIMMVYGLVLIVAIIGSQVMEKRFTGKLTTPSPPRGGAIPPS